MEALTLSAKISILSDAKSPILSNGAEERKQDLLSRHKIDCKTIFHAWMDEIKNSFDILIDGIRERFQRKKMKCLLLSLLLSLEFSIKEIYFKPFLILIKNDNFYINL